jgi:hypothetical protein
MPDNKPNDNEDKKEVITPTDLEEVHAKAVEDIDKEVTDDDADKSEEVSDAKDEEPNDEPDTKDEEADDKADEPKPEPKVEVPTSPEEEPDIVSAVQEKIPKIKVKDSEGKEHEFASTDEIPDDFEPETYKAFAVATSKLAQREIAVEREVKKAQTEKIDKERNERIEKIKEQWDVDLKALVKSGDIPKDEAEQKPVVDGVYKIMQDEMTAGRPVNSFTQAFEIYSYRQSLEDKKKSQEKINDEKKKRGAMILPGGSANPGKAKTKVFEAPPSGVSLDQVHEKVLGSL